MSNIARKTTESTIAVQAGDVAPALLADPKREIYDDLAAATESLLGSCFVEAGNRTRSAPIGYTVDFWEEFGGSAKVVQECIRMIMKAKDVYLGGFAELRAEEELAAPRTELYEEIDVLAESLAHISGVEELKVRETKWGFETWIVVNNASEESRYAIYDVEWELMRRFPDCTFDFHLIDRDGMDLSSIVSFGEETLTIAIRRRDYAR